MYRPQSFRQILNIGSAMAALAALVPLGAPPLPDPAEHVAPSLRKYARHTHLPKGMDAKGYALHRSRPRGATSTLKKTARLLARQAVEARR